MKVQKSPFFFRSENPASQWRLITFLNSEELSRNETAGSYVDFFIFLKEEKKRGKSNKLPANRVPLPDRTLQRMMKSRVCQS